VRDEVRQAARRAAQSARNDLDHGALWLYRMVEEARGRLPEPWTLEWESAVGESVVLHLFCGSDDGGSDARTWIIDAEDPADLAQALDQAVDMARADRSGE
jgi:hypothetical protein